MTKTIETLVDDIHDVLSNGADIPEELLERFGKQVARTVADGLKRDYVPALRMSAIGKPCERDLYYGINHPEDKEPFTPSTYMKFLIGHVLEDVLLLLVELAGHSVEGRQDEQEIAGIKGHRDVVIDGVTVDAKSASTYSFAKFETGLTKEQDAFGYLDQIQSYVHAGQSDPVVTDKSRGAFLVVDKTLGHICLDVHEKEDFPIEEFYERKKAIVAGNEVPPRGFDPVPDGKSGNMKLGTNCSYCDFKKKCHPGLRAFAYSGRPVFLTTVEKEPKVPEIENF